MLVPLIPVAPFFVGTMWYSAANYYVKHRRSHLDVEWAKEHLPWHYDHHMGPNQHANWCVTWPWFDFVMGTRKPYVQGATESTARTPVLMVHGFASNHEVWTTLEPGLRRVKEEDRVEHLAPGLRQAELAVSVFQTHIELLQGTHVGLGFLKQRREALDGVNLAGQLGQNRRLIAAAGTHFKRLAQGRPPVEQQFDHPRDDEGL